VYAVAPASGASIRTQRDPLGAAIGDVAAQSTVTAAAAPRVADCDDGVGDGALTADGRLPRSALADAARFSSPPNVTWLPAATFHAPELVADDGLIAHSRRWAATSWGRAAPPPPPPPPPPATAAV
jgi:hypothetical protein